MDGGPKRATDVGLPAPVDVIDARNPLAYRPASSWPISEWGVLLRVSGAHPGCPSRVRVSRYLQTASGSGGQRAEKRGEPFRHRRVDQDCIAQRRVGQACGHR